MFAIVCHVSKSADFALLREDWNCNNIIALCSCDGTGMVFIFVYCVAT